MTVEQQTHAELLETIAGLEPGPAIELLRSRGLDRGVLPALIDAAEGLVIADLSRALDVTQRLVALADAIGPEVPRARARRAWAQALAYANRFQEAIGALNEATALADSAGAPVEAARARLTTLHALARMGRFDDAVEAGLAARAAFIEAGEPVLAARADINLGVTQRMRDRPREAIAHFDLARLALTEQPMLLAQLESNRAEALLDLNRFGEAERAFESARAEFLRIGARRAAGIVEGNLADLASRQGRLDQALGHFEGALRQLGESESPGDTARLLAEQAEAFAAIGMHAEAAEAYRRAAPVLQEKRMAWESARALAGLGRTLVALGRPDEARAQLAIAAEAFSALRHSTGLGRVRLSQAAAAARASEAEVLLMQAMNLLADRPAELVLTRLHLSSLALQAGRFDEADKLAHAALAEARQLDLAPLVADLLHAIARVHRARGRLADAVATLREAIGEVERVRGMLGADRFRAAFLGGRLAVYEDAVAAVLDQDGPDAAAEAFTLAERAKSRSLLDLLHGGGQLAESLVPSAAEPGDAKLLADLARLRGELNALYAQLDDPAGRRSYEPGVWRRAVRDHESKIAGLEGRLAATRRYASVFGEPVGLAAARAMLEPGAGLVEFFEECGRFSAIVATGDGATVVRGLATPAEIREHVEGLYFQIGRAVSRGLPDGPAGERLAAAAESETAALHRLLIDPLRASIAPLQRIIFVPHGVLHAVPFHALSGGRGPLCEAFEIAYAPSASVLDQLVRRPTGPAEGARVVVGLSDELIPHAEREARAVAARLGGARLITGADATIARVSEAMRGASLVHLATHARFIASHPLASGVKLADGWLTARDIYGLRLDGAEVVLSGCDTGRSVAAAGEELMGLSRAFLVAGARSLVMSLWPAHDQSTAEFMVSIYGDRYDGGRPGPGLCGPIRSAWTSLRARRGHIAAWAPFVLIGAT
ncbi:MAG: CHAT domain-containing protein [Phycisphaerales bacterium]|nr:CHAT domain-containing protein [Phycisphaerales bacterium]